MKLAGTWKQLRTKLSANRKRWMIIGGAVVGVGAAVAFVSFTDTGGEVFEDVRETVAGKATLSELKQRVRAEPNDGSHWARLGAAQFEGGFKAAGLKSYDRALQIDADLADDEVLKHLVSCYGAPEQSRAHAILVKHKLTRAERYLDDLSKSPRWLVRTGAIQTLEKLGKVTRDDYVNLWVTDLKSSKECKVRQYAVEKLGELGDKRGLEAIRAVKKHEDETTPWFTPKCVGGRAEDAEKKILASR